MIGQFGRIVLWRELRIRNPSDDGALTCLRTGADIRRLNADLPSFTKASDGQAQTEGADEGSIYADIVKK